MKVAKSKPSFLESLVAEHRATIKRAKNPDVEDALSLTLLSEMPDENPVSVYMPTGIPPLDRHLGGGYANGRVTEIYGPESAGKSATADLAMKSVAAMGGVVLLVEFEPPRDPRRMHSLMVAGKDSIARIRPDNDEIAWKFVFKLLRKNRKLKKSERKPILIVWDTVAATVTADDEKRMEKSDQGGQIGDLSRAISKNLRRVTNRLANAHAHLLLINQERSVIGEAAMYGPKTESVGGKAIRFYASTRIRQTSSAWRDGGKKVGLLVRGVIRKEKYEDPTSMYGYCIHYKRGVSPGITLAFLLKKARIMRPLAKQDGKRLFKVEGIKGKRSIVEWERVLSEKNELTEKLWLAVKDVKIVGGE